MRSIIVMVVCAVFSGCTEMAGGDVPPGPELHGTYEVGQTFRISPDCQGVLPSVTYLTLNEGGTAELDDGSDLYLALWSATAAGGFMLEHAHSFAWSAPMTLFELGDDGETFEASMTWWNSTTRQTCTVETWATRVDP